MTEPVKPTADELALSLLSSTLHTTPGDAKRLLAEIKTVYARELAKKIRTTDLPEIHVDMFDNGTQWAADLIDPEEPTA